jgi:transcriptional regulator with XRE-family HTH domain
MTTDEFRAAIKAMGWTQAKAAQELRMTDRSVRRMLSGEWPVSKRVSTDLAQRLKENER